MLSGIITLLLMLLFVGIWAWAWQPRKRAGFDEAARLALDDDATDDTRVAAHNTRTPRA